MVFVVCVMWEVCIMWCDGYGLVCVRGGVWYGGVWCGVVGVPKVKTV